MKVFVILLALLLKFARYDAQSTARPIDDFDQDRILGVWYVIARSADANPQLRCPITNWTLAEPAGLNFAISALNRTNGVPINSDLLLTYVGDTDESIFTASANNQTVGLRQIIATDYTRYNLIYGHNDAQDVDVLFLLARSRGFTSQFLIPRATSIALARGINLPFTLFDNSFTCNN